MIPNILSIAGSDPSGGAGIQADLKSIEAAGGFGMAAIATLTAQNTCGVDAIFTPPPSFLRAQLEAIAADIRIDAVKVGMLAEAAVVDIVADFLEPLEVPIIVDPVMVATSGARLTSENASLDRLIAQATVVTPNIPELAALSGESPTTLDEAVAVAQRWQATMVDAPAVLVKGGHLKGPADNILVMPDGTTTLAPSERIDTTNTHGTGCSLSSAIATRAALEPLPEAVLWATEWLHGAIASADELSVGKGHGPVRHAWRGTGI